MRFIRNSFRLDLGGPRIRIDWRFAMLSMKSMLANFLMKYEVTTTLKYEEIELELQKVNIVKRYLHDQYSRQAELNICQLSKKNKKANSVKIEKYSKRFNVWLSRESQWY